MDLFTFLRAKPHVKQLASFGDDSSLVESFFDARTPCRRDFRRLISYQVELTAEVLRDKTLGDFSIVSKISLPIERLIIRTHLIEGKFTRVYRWCDSDELNRRRKALDDD